MKSTDNHPAKSKDGLPWMMRIGGVLVIALSAFLLIKDVSLGIGDDVFCAFSLGLGLFTTGASWLPNR